MTTIDAEPFFDGINPEPRFAVRSDGEYIGCITVRTGFAHRYSAEGFSSRSWRTEKEMRAEVLHTFGVAPTKWGHWQVWQRNDIGHPVTIAEFSTQAAAFERLARITA